MDSSSVAGSVPRVVLTLTLAVAASSAWAQPWTYVEVDSSRQKWGDWDEPEWLRYFGLGAHDANGDGRLDLVSGRYVYLCPPGDLADRWPRVDLGRNVDGLLMLDVDGDELADVIAVALPNVYWFEATDATATAWRSTKVAVVQATGHVNGQGYRVADIVPGGQPEILLAGGEGIYVIEPTPQLTDNLWPTRLLVECSDEGFAVGDLDADGDLDLVAAAVVDGEPRQLLWWRNPGDPALAGATHTIAESDHPIDRIEVADLNGDGRLDVVYSEERFPGKEPDARLVWLAAPADAAAGGWTAEVLVTQYSMNNLDVGDLDADGDTDIVTSEHKGKRLAVQAYVNDGRGRFEMTEIDRGKEMHLGARLADLDGDGDLDLFGHAWDNHRYLHLWRNDRIRR